ncbi:hypothetical protein Cni_G20639 [Canna indica]|uniref:Uncharacterized protein n=1 Tax=Canna indica TaxID=4628 RepID=A0AAQ3KNI1_9LILI|nr:hypothetical protein Cni_G20639 [Canna indica]
MMQGGRCPLLETVLRNQQKRRLKNVYQKPVEKPSSWVGLFRRTVAGDDWRFSEEFNGKIKKIQETGRGKVYIDEEKIDITRKSCRLVLYGKFFGITPALELVRGDLNYINSISEKMGGKPFKIGKSVTDYKNFLSMIGLMDWTKEEEVDLSTVMKLENLKPILGKWNKEDVGILEKDLKSATEEMKNWEIREDIIISAPH